MPLFRRMAKRGFNNKAFADVVAILNVATLEEVFEKGEPSILNRCGPRGWPRGGFDLLKIPRPG
ncbi:MAG: hypothetical protein Ct9H300mP1_08180 [Planctomycetaceae bacterium]|nr:MAG: hypothetical protein Ct9H300mP1_08180 [Planctomycetaceae bacterium]